MTEAVAQDGEVKPVSAAETMAQKLQKQAEINKRVLEAMASSNDESDVKFLFQCSKLLSRRPLPTFVNTTQSELCRMTIMKH